MPMRTGLSVVFTILCIAAALLLPAVPQSLEYHHFADQRDLWQESPTFSMWYPILGS